MSLRGLWALALAGFAAASAPSTRAEPVDAGHLVAELVADRTGVAPGGAIHVALRQKIEDGWHTYWRNPGDSGQATTLTWTLPAGWRAGDIVWAAPQRLPIGPLMDYGYSGEVLLPVALTAPASAKPGQTVTLKAQAAFLVCKDVCVPEDASLALTLPVVGGPAAPDPTWGPRIEAALADAPRPAGLRAAMTATSTAVRLSVVGARLKGGALSSAYFYPYDGSFIDHPKPQAVDLGPDGLTLTLAPGYAFKSGRPPAAMAGVLSVGGAGGDHVYEIEARAGAPLAGAAGLGPPQPPLTFAASARRLALALAFAFAGGLILNLMPCVFPVLSMKAAALAGRAHAPGGARAEGLAFLGGVVVAFLVLAGALIAARAAGQAVGWGFQLQSPAVVAGLMLIMLLAALNLSGLFEIGAGVQSLAGGARLADQGGALGAAFTGVLAVAVAAPCTAPFMAGAIGFALTQGPAPALAVFLALALGLAAPFTALAFAPALLRRLPRPGAWMEGLRKALAFPMYAAAAWLLWVASQQVGPLGLAGLLAAGVLAGLGAWLYGVAQRRRLVGGSSRAASAGATLAAALALGAAVWSVTDGGTSRAPPGEAASAAELPSLPFSPERLAALRAQGRPVLVNFTAAWCVTCQVNDRLALSGRSVVETFRKAGVVYLKGDWTNRDPVIAQALAEHGRAGVPLYLMYGADGGEPAVLPQVLTPGVVEDAVRKAAKS
jgi:thiol:disulfide interchange protein/DsbC/DsbD-like thiol-disulfide interchange protein